LREAARREPRNFVTWALLGDLAVRSGNMAVAKQNYRRALALNPRDVGLRQHVRDAAR
jgi:cytochrome c-type biogenesis protein CcmH/NrfG